MLHVRNELTNEAQPFLLYKRKKQTHFSMFYLNPVLNSFDSVFFALAMFVIMWLAWQRIHGK